MTRESKFVIRRDHWTVGETTYHTRFARFVEHYNGLVVIVVSPAEYVQQRATGDFKVDNKLAIFD